MKYAYLTVALLGAVGCSNPTAPSSITRDPQVEVLLSKLDEVDTRLPWNGLTFREWAAQTPITIAPLDQRLGAVWNGREVVLNANLTGYDDAGKAALIAHELRHADGIVHDCGPEQDHRATPWSAYAVHVWTLNQLGEFDQARGNEGGFCD